MKRNDRSIRQVILSRQNRILARKDSRSLLRLLILAALFGWLLLSQVFLFCQCRGNGMFPFLMDGDLLIGYRLQETYVRNDTVLYTQAGVRQVGRIVACPGDQLDFQESGILRINGTQEAAAVFYPTYGEKQSASLVVPEDCIFILGDCRTDSEDSRTFGPVSIDQVQAKVITVLRRRKI